MEKELFVVAGLTRLTVPVVDGLRQRRPDAEVVVVATEPDRVYGPMIERCGVPIVLADRGLEPALREAVDLKRAACLLAVSDSDLDNVRAAVICHAVAPEVPIVVRLFDRIMSDQLERQDSIDGQALRVRRAYSMAGLAAPKFLAAALGQSETHLLTMRFAEGEIPFLRLTPSEGSPIVGRTVGSLEESCGCAVVAMRDPDGTWSSAPADDVTVSADDTLVVGGPEATVFRLAAETYPPRTSVAVGAQRRERKSRARQVQQRRARNITLLPRVAIGLALVTIASMVVVRVWGGRRGIDAFYWTMTAAAGGAPAGEPASASASWLRIFAAVPIIAGGALAGVLFSYLASVATAQRLEQRMDRKAGRMHGHVVVGGLGTVGYRVERLLWRLGEQTVVIERDPNAQFPGGLQSDAPVLHGDVRLTSSLERAGVKNAKCIIAVTNDDLVNVEACLSARNINPKIRTVARIFDETLAGRAKEAFGIDECFSAVQAASPAFVDAATDPHALRLFRLNGSGYRALRYVATRTVEVEELDLWRSRGLRVVATRHGGDPVRESALVGEPLHTGDSAIVAGPEDEVQRLADTLAPTAS